MVKKEKRAKKRKLKGKESFSNIYMVYMTLSHQNEAQKAKITSQKASERVDTVLKGQKSENMTETHKNKAQKAKITTQRASERVGTVLKGQKSENVLSRDHHAE